MPSFASRMDRIIGSATVAVGNRVAQLRAEGVDVISFAAGEPDFVTPLHVRQAAKDALDAGHTHYTPGPGIPALRQAVADFHGRHNSIPCDPANVLCTPTKQAVTMAILALADKGDDVLLPDPAWVSYEPIIRWAHGNPVAVGLEAETEFRMTPEAVADAITPASRAIILNSPSNPTGGVNTPDDVRGIVELAIDHDLWIISDEIYQHLVYEGEHLSPASLPDAFDRTITIDGLSKSFAMTGWRTGWLVAPAEAHREINKLQEHSITHVTSFAQYGAVAALTGPQASIAEMREAFIRRRRLMVDGLNAIDGVSCPEPRGAFYVFPRVDQAADGNDEGLCMRLLDEAHVATTFGSAFGARGDGHLRLSYATSDANIEAGLARIAAAV